MNPHHQVTWRSQHPDFSIRHLRGTSTNRGYHEDVFEVLSLRPLGTDDFKRLDDCYLLGSGQEYRVGKSEVVEEVVQPAVVDRRTGKAVECDCGHVAIPCKETCASIPRNYRGEVYTATHTIEHHRYEVLRICDSGD